MTPISAYADLEIRILGQEEAGYPVEITVNSEQEYPRGYLSAQGLPWRRGPNPEQDGRKLFDWLFADDNLKRAWAEVRGQHSRRRIRLRIDASDPELHAIPWELLREEEAGGVPLNLAAAEATPFSRYLAGKWQPGSPILKRPIKTLVAMANPKGLADYDLAAIDEDREWALLQEATAGLPVELIRLDGPCTLPALEAELKKGYHILHFIGHGQYDKDRQGAYLYLADPAQEDEIAFVYDQDFAQMLARQLADVGVQRDDKLRLVFLASCQTATRSLADALRGFAPALIKAGVPAVVGMQDFVSVPTAQKFAATFYRQLLDHGQVDLAGNEARAAVLTADLPGASIPVLFMRLRSGALLGQRGRISSDRASTFWPFLLENIDRGQCLPFLGPRVNAGLLPDRETVAATLADKFGYPLPDRHNLVRVAQYMAINDPGLLRDDYLRLMQRSLFMHLGLKPTEEDKRRFRRMGFSETAEALNWAEAVLAVQENEIHHLLADLDFPLYLTTNFDNFMTEALKHKGLTPRREGPRWEQDEAGSPQYVLTPRPSREQPVVFHLNGHDGDPEQRQKLVLSEDDYLAHFVRISRDQETILPMNVLEALSQSSFIFLGYNLGDWEFRVILQGLLASIAQTGPSKKLHVGVQLEIDQAPDVDRAMDYLRDYLDEFNIDIYWGTPQQFVTELHARWQEYLEAGDDW
ncbi:MAG: CHAT domain-containing protein [Anaerolineae bacterium]